MTENQFKTFNGHRTKSDFVKYCFFITFCSIPGRLLKADGIFQYQNFKALRYAIGGIKL